MAMTVNAVHTDMCLLQTVTSCWGMPRRRDFQSSTARTDSASCPVTLALRFVSERLLTYLLSFFRVPAVVVVLVSINHVTVEKCPPNADNCAAVRATFDPCS